MAEEELCNHCGAPRVAGYAACKYCKTPFVQNAQTGAIPCPRCNTLNEMGAQRCVQCQAWVVVQCVFCHALSPHNVSGCLKCGEAFAGAPQRFAERQRAEHLQQGLNVASTVGNVAASFLGAAAGAGAFSHHDSYEHHHHHEHYRGDESYEPRPDWNQGTGAGIAQSSQSSGGFFDSLFGSSSNSGTGADIAQSRESSGGGFFSSLFGGSSDDSGTGAGIAQSNDSGGGFFDSDQDHS